MTTITHTCWGCRGDRRRVSMHHLAVRMWCGEATENALRPVLRKFLRTRRGRGGTKMSLVRSRLRIQALHDMCGTSRNFSAGVSRRLLTREGLQLSRRTLLNPQDRPGGFTRYPQRCVPLDFAVLASAGTGSSRRHPVAELRHGFQLRGFLGRGADGEPRRHACHTNNREEARHRPVMP